MSANWKFRDRKEKPLLLFSCLDWGLGHTTRSVPLLKEFIDLGCDLIVACNSIQKIVFEREIEGLKFVELDGYGVRYGKTLWGTRFNLAWQLRKILIRIKIENRWLEGFLVTNKVDGLISDNRYGLHHPSIPTIFITHQLQIHSGYGRAVDLILQKFLYKFINRFTTCWVPDHKDKNVLAGKLSHPVFFPTCRVEYIGPLSRFNTCDNATDKKYDVLVILSGPEPQRSLFEKMILDQASLLSEKKIALVRGLPAASATTAYSSIEIFNHLGAVELNKLICESAIVVCRPGYTTIMDMMKLKKKMVVVPTPGQSEQEYLARFLSANNYVVSIKQSKFNLQVALQKADNFIFNHIDDNMDEYKIVLKNFVDKISS